MTDSTTDSLFAHPMGTVGAFTFDESVAAVFPDMIRRSVPGYSTVVAMSGVLAEHFSQPGSKLYDLGCSLGATSFSMAQRAANGCHVVAVDNSEAMIKQFRQVLQDNPTPVPVDVICDDINNVAIDEASMVALNYTLQFIEPALRSTLLENICRGMNKGGVLVLSEKICFDDTTVNELFIDLHHDFKRANGYSDLEISQKRDAIENVLLPETLPVHKRRLLDAGFERVEVWFQCFNFASLVAFK